MNPKIFEWFGNWFKKNDKLLKQKGLKLDFSEKKVEQVIYTQSVEIESSRKWGVVIVYSVGTCDTHTGNLETDEDFGASADFINSEEALNELLKDYIQNF